MRKPLIVQWVEDYWEYNVSEGANIFNMNGLMHNLVNKILITGDE